MQMTEAYNKYRVITPSDTVDLPDGICDAIYCASSSDITIVGDDDVAVLFTTVPAGILKVRAKRLNATSTGTGPFVALYTV